MPLSESGIIGFQCKNCEYDTSVDNTGCNIVALSKQTLLAVISIARTFAAGVYSVFSSKGDDPFL